jgi:hypothetical protein
MVNLFLNIFALNFYFYIKKLYNIVILYNMDSTPSSKNMLSTDIICDILIVIFIVIFAYYILGDKFENFSSENKIDTIKIENNENKNENEIEHDILSSTSENTHLFKEKANKSKKVTFNNSSDLINTSKYGSAEFSNDAPETASNKSLELMNKYGKTSNRNYNCDLLGLDSNDLKQFKKDYYGMYSHQLECPKNCYMNKMGTKKCGLDSDKGCNGVFTTDYNNPDVFALSYMSLLNNDKKSCAACTQNTSPEDKERLKQMKLTNANISNIVNFGNNVNLNSEGETQVDKMAEIRTCTTGTCNLQDYGKSIKDIYNNLVDTPAYTNRNKCDPYQLTGYNQYQMLGDNYEEYNKSD